MNAPLLLSILIVLVCAAFSRRSKSLAEDKVDGLLDKIKMAKTMHYRLKGSACKVKMEYCYNEDECCESLGLQCSRSGMCKPKFSG